MKFTPSGLCLCKKSMNDKGKMLQETCVKMSKGASWGEIMLELGHFKQTNDI
jgi:hypothetical protein